MTPIESIPNSIGETLQRVVLPGGLTCLLNPRPDFQRTFAVVATNFGSLDHSLPQGANQPAHRVPEGVAHFLEHKLFEDQEGDVSHRFSARGASCNAATEFTKTSYHFSCSGDVADNLRTLLRFVFQPYFTAESVAKEQGIIEQEIRMYEDDSDWRIFFQLLRGLYHHHPVREDIAGTVESIHQIDPDLLYQCHKFYYHPANMVLVMSGGFVTEPMLEIVHEIMDPLGTEGGERYQRPVFEEPSGTHQRRSELVMPVSRPQVCIGFKDQQVGGTAMDAQVSLRRDLTTRLLLDVLFSPSSHLHQRLYEQGVIDDSFEASYSEEHDFGFTVIGAEADQPDEFVATIHEALREAARQGFGAEDFERLRRRLLGRYVRVFNSVEAVAGTLVNCEFRGIHPDELIRVASELTTDDLQKRLADHLREDHSCLSIIWPRDDARATES
jgi:predicted Zn-dependent peptidase